DIDRHPAAPSISQAKCRSRNTERGQTDEDKVRPIQFPLGHRLESQSRKAILKSAVTSPASGSDMSPVWGNRNQPITKFSLILRLRPIALSQVTEIRRPPNYLVP